MNSRDKRCDIIMSKDNDLYQNLLEAGIQAEPYEQLLGELSTLLAQLDVELYLFGVSASNVESLLLRIRKDLQEKLQKKEGK